MNKPTSIENEHYWGEGRGVLSTTSLKHDSAPCNKSSLRFAKYGGESYLLLHVPKRSQCDAHDEFGTFVR